MTTINSTLFAAHGLLQSKGAKVSWEYPGCIHIDVGGHYTLWVGTANDDFGADLVRNEEDLSGTEWNDEGLDWSMDPSTDADALAASLLALTDTVRAMPKVASAIRREQRMKDAVEKASDAFWASVVESFPEAVAGDFGPEETFRWERACAEAIRLWVRWNVREAEAK